MDALVLLEQIEDLVNNSNRTLSGNVVKINADELSRLVEDLRAELVDELRQARQIVKEKDEILNEARKEAETIMEEVENNISTMIDEDEVHQEAKRQAEEMLEQAGEKAEKIKSGATDYADDVLGNLETYLTKTLRTIEEGRKQIHERSPVEETE